jgi:aryl carrier-like protein
MLLEKLPLNANGKINRKNLPSPSLSYLSSTRLSNHVKQLVPTNEIEISIHHIWCEIFQQNQISIDTNLFTIGGHSLLLMQLFHRYKTQFHLQTNTLCIADLFQHPTIIDHAQLISQTFDNIPSIGDFAWSTLNLIQGKRNNFLLVLSTIFCLFLVARASFAQERIFLDEQIRFASKNNNIMYLIPQLYRVTSTTNHVSISRLCRALQTVITRHHTLRTALFLDTNATITQHYLDSTVIDDDIKPHGFSVINLPHGDNDDDHSIDETINNIINRHDLFDLSQGRVIHCHILRHCRTDDDFSFENDDLLSKDDWILFCMHHSAFDGTSTSTFLRDLSLAYETDCSLPMNDNTLQYIDYAVHERLKDVTSSQDFWHSELTGHYLQRPLSLPTDRYRSSSDERSGLASVAQISFNDDVTTSFLNYIFSHQVTPFQLGLSIFYAFLFKLTHGENDLCIACLNANRLRTELQNIIGMFVTTLPYRVQIDFQWSFDELVKHMREKCLSILEHSHYPLQNILANTHLKQSNIEFFETMFDFVTISSDINQLFLDRTTLEQISLSQSSEVAKFDLMLKFFYDSTLNDGRSGLSCRFVCSRDLFDEMTVANMARRFEHLFFQVFSSKFNTTQNEQSNMSISKLSLILPEEAKEMQEILFPRLSNILNEGMYISMYFSID